MEQMPSPARAERNQARKRAFIPVWPLLAAGAVMLLMVLFLR
jgi:type VI protein secretion system component VasF